LGLRRVRCGQVWASSLPEDDCGDDDNHSQLPHSALTPTLNILQSALESCALYGRYKIDPAVQAEKPRNRKAKSFACGPPASKK
jgi:hypothetical protein